MPSTVRRAPVRVCTSLPFAPLTCSDAHQSVSDLRTAACDAGDDRQQGDGREQRRQRHRFVERRCLAAEEVADRRAQEPDAHHQADDARRRELGHRAETDRTQAELRQRVNQIDHEQPRSSRPWRRRRAICAPGTSTRNPSPTPIRPSANFVGLDGCAVAEPDPEPGEHRREDEDEHRIQRLPPAARERRSRTACCACCGRQTDSASSRPARTRTRTAPPRRRRRR